MNYRDRVGFFFFLLLLFSLGGCGKEPVAKVGDVAPDFSLQTVGGEEITLGQYKGKDILLFFWTQGCVFCRTSSIILVNHIYKKGQQSGLTVISINVAESKGDVAQFVREKGLIYPVLMDRDAHVSRKKFGVYVVPTFFIIGKDGVIKRRIDGHVMGKDLLDFVEPYLRKKD